MDMDGICYVIFQGTDYPNLDPAYLSCALHSYEHRKRPDAVEFFLNGAELSLNSVNSANLGNLINH